MRISEGSRNRCHFEIGCIILTLYKEGSFKSALSFTHTLKQNRHDMHRSMICFVYVRDLFSGKGIHFLDLGT